MTDNLMEPNVLNDEYPSLIGRIACTHAGSDKSSFQNARMEAWSRVEYVQQLLETENDLVYILYINSKCSKLASRSVSTTEPKPIGEPIEVLRH